MIIVSLENTNTNTNTLNVNVIDGQTIFEIFESADVREFFENAAPSEIADAVESLDGADVEAIRSHFTSITATDDMELDINLYGEHLEEATEEELGKASISRGGGMSKKEVAVISGKTTVADMITPAVADFFASDVSTLSNMRVYINGEEATMNSTINSGDAVVLEARKAGDKGAETVKVIDMDGTEKNYVWEPDNSETPFDVLWKVIEDGYLTADAEILSINGDEIPAAYYDTIVNSAGVDLVTMEVDEVFAEKDDVEEDRKETAEEETAKAPAAGTVGKVKVYIQGGCQNKEVNIVSGVTTLKEVVLSDRILNLAAMTEEMARNLIYYINDVKSCLDTPLTAGDEIKMEARKAGDKGNC